jgi:hypothetical protein
MGGIPCGNANPDPCICGRQESDPAVKTQCDQERACQADGGTWNPYTEETSSGTVISAPHCEYPDGGSDAAISDGGMD